MPRLPFSPTRLLLLVAAPLLCPAAAHAYAYNYELGFSSLPSQQGWVYLADGAGASIPDSDLFSVNGSTLQQDTRGIPIVGGGSNVYLLPLTFAVGDFSLTMRGVLRQAEGSYPFGFSFGIQTAAEYLLAGFSDTQLSDGTMQTGYPEGINPHDPHTYNFTRTNGATSFSIDGQVVSTGAGGTYGGDLPGDYLILGDATGFANAAAVVQSYTFSADPAAAPVPEPASAAVFAAGLLLAPVLRRRNGGRRNGGRQNGSRKTTG